MLVSSWCLTRGRVAAGSSVVLIARMFEWLAAGGIMATVSTVTAVTEMHANEEQSEEYEEPVLCEPAHVSSSVVFR